MEFPSVDAPSTQFQTYSSGVVPRSHILTFTSKPPPVITNQYIHSVLTQSPQNSLPPPIRHPGYPAIITSRDSKRDNIVCSRPGSLPTRVASPPRTWSSAFSVLFPRVFPSCDGPESPPLPSCRPSRLRPATGRRRATEPETESATRHRETRASNPRPTFEGFWK